MKLKNSNIIQHYEKLNQAFNDNTKYFPAKLVFAIRKNINILKTASDEINSTRDNIIIHYGTPSEDGTYFIPPEQRATAQKELDELLDMEQEISLFKLNLLAIEDIEFTSNQMEALIFMINDDQVDC